MMTSKISVIVLAAGKSLRMGRPKMVLPWRGTTVLGRVVAVFAEAGLQNIIIVTGGDREKVERETARLKNTFPVTTVYNPDHENGGMLSSILTGLSIIPRDADAVLVGLGDQPQVETETVRNILDLFHRTRPRIIIPSCNHRRGHPILIDSGMIQELEKSRPESTLREFLNSNLKEISYLEANISVLQDLDTPRDYEQSLGKNKVDQDQSNP
jgi:molybdenum cofactor cytidylyltransferase